MISSSTPAQKNMHRPMSMDISQISAIPHSGSMKSLPSAMVVVLFFVFKIISNLFPFISRVQLVHQNHQQSFAFLIYPHQDYHERISKMMIKRIKVIIVHNQLRTSNYQDMLQAIRSLVSVVNL